jgi:AraC-like DNA-binding protein
MQNVWRYGSKFIEQEYFGYSVAASLNPASFNGLIPGLYASQTLLEMLQRFIRYRKVISHSFDVKLIDQGDSILLLINDKRQIKTEATSITTIFFLLKVCRDLYGPNFSAKKIYFKNPMSRQSGKIQDKEHIDICYNANCSAILFSKELLLQPLLGIEPNLAHQQDKIVENYLKNIELRETMSGRVHLNILESLAKGEVSLDGVAKTFYVSPRTLQRKLKLEDSSYVAILDEARKQLAIEYAQKPECHVKEIAYYLGFSDSATFSRAFKRWTSVSFTDYRQYNLTK